MEKQEKINLFKKLSNEFNESVLDVMNENETFSAINLYSYRFIEKFKKIKDFQDNFDRFIDVKFEERFFILNSYELIKTIQENELDSTGFNLSKMNYLMSEIVKLFDKETKPQEYDLIFESKNGFKLISSLSNIPYKTENFLKDVLGELEELMNFDFNIIKISIDKESEKPYNIIYDDSDNNSFAEIFIPRTNMKIFADISFFIMCELIKMVLNKNGGVFESEKISIIVSLKLIRDKFGKDLYKRIYEKHKDYINSNLPTKSEFVELMENPMNELLNI